MSGEDNDFKHVVKILNGEKEPIGSGILINNTVITADHIFKSFDEAYIRHNDSDYIARFEYFGREDSIDLVILKVDISTDYKPDYIEDLPEKIPEKILSKTLYIKGFPIKSGKYEGIEIVYKNSKKVTAKLISKNNVFKISSHDASSVEEYLYSGERYIIKSDSIITAGFSGCPVFYDDNCILGLVVSLPIYEEDGLVTDIIPIKTVFEIIPEYKNFFGENITNRILFDYADNSAERYNSPIQYNNSKLHYSSQSVKLYGRGEYIESLKNFCGYDKHMKPLNNQKYFSWWVITGEGGSGKSRLALDFSIMMEEVGWTVCRPPNHNYDTLIRCSESLPNKTLFILDYSEYDFNSIVQWLSCFNTNYYQNRFIRVLLIQRVDYRQENLYPSKQSDFIKAHLHNEDFLKINPPDEESLRNMQREYAMVRGKELTEKDTELLLDKLKNIDEELMRPLFALIVVDIFIDYQENTYNLSRDELLDKVCEKDYEMLKFDIYTACGNNREDLQELSLAILIMATMMDGVELTEEDLGFLIPEEYNSIIDKTNQMTRQSRNRYFSINNLFINKNKTIFCPPIEPDIIGEFFVLKYLKEQLGEEDYYISRAWSKPYFMSRFVNRVYQDYEESSYLEDYHKFFTEVDIPDSVTEICEYAFERCGGLTSIKIPDSVISIGRSAFFGCSGLTSIKIPDSVTEIGSRAFHGCSSLTSINIPDSVTEIGSRAFYGCSSLMSINIPDSLTKIRLWAFEECSSLTSINIPDSVTEIDIGAFEGCSSLTSINIPDSVTKIGNRAFYKCSSLISMTIPDSVASIGKKAFERCVSLTNIKISDLVTSVSDRTFYECISLISINIPDSVASIGKWAFYKCSSLTSMTIPDSVASIGREAFCGCSSLTNIRILDSVTSIGMFDFCGCSSLTSITIPGSVTIIEMWAFYECSNLTSINIPDSVTFIHELAFEGCINLDNKTRKQILKINPEAIFD